MLKTFRDVYFKALAWLYFFSTGFALPGGRMERVCVKASLRGWRG